MELGNLIEQIVKIGLFIVFVIWTIFSAFKKKEAVKKNIRNSNPQKKTVNKKNTVEHAGAYEEPTDWQKYMSDVFGADLTTMSSDSYHKQAPDISPVSTVREEKVDRKVVEAYAKEKSEKKRNSYIETPSTYDPIMGKKQKVKESQSKVSMSPDELRKAIIWSEILKPPKGLE